VETFRLVVKRSFFTARHLPERILAFYFRAIIFIKEFLNSQPSQLRIEKQLIPFIPDKQRNIMRVNSRMLREAEIPKVIIEQLPAYISTAEVWRVLIFADKNVLSPICCAKSGSVFQAKHFPMSFFFSLPEWILLPALMKFLMTFPAHGDYIPHALIAKSLVMQVMGLVRPVV
jgi:hypothetical protein